MRAMELFVGAGGLGMGISAGGFTSARIVEWDRWCCDTLRENRKRATSPIHKWPEPVEDDVRDVAFSDLLGKVDLVAGGPPCQPFSLGGRHRANDDHRDMWAEAVRVVRETRPRAFIFENVKGLTRAAFAPYLGYILLQLQHPSLARGADESWRDHLDRLQRHHTSGGKIEYRVVQELLNSADYGVPQKRERVIFVGFAEGIEADWSFPRPTHSYDALAWAQARGSYWDDHRVAAKDQALSARLLARGAKLRTKPAELPWRTVRDGLCNLPDPERDPAGAACFANHKFQPGARVYPGHTGSLLDEPAKTLKAGVHGVPGGENMLRRADGTVRYFSIRESARLQTFDDGYILHGAWSEAMRQLGNAVPVELAKVIATSVRQHLELAGIAR